MILSNQYWYFSSALTEDQCNKIVELGLDRIEKTKQSGLSTIATTAGNNHKQAMNDAIAVNDKSIDELEKDLNIERSKIKDKSYVRDSEVTWLNDQWIFDLVSPYVQTANERAGWNFDYDWNELFQFTVYHKGGFYGWHTDGGGDRLSAYRRFIPGISSQKFGKMKYGHTRDHKSVGKIRKLSVTINLCKPGDYEGGNLKFDFGPHAERERFHECTEIRPQGSIIVFPSFTHHQVTPITRGTRYSLVLWVLGKPFR